MLMLELTLLHPVTEFSPWLNAASAIFVYSGTVHPGWAITTAARPTWTARTPSLTLSSGLKTDVAHPVPVMSFSRFGWPSGRRAAFSQPHAGVSCIRPNDLLSASVQPTGVLHGLSGL